MALAERADEVLGVERAFAYFREQLLSGALKPGDRLMGERELSLSLGVSRPVLREALRSLAMLGFLDIRHGKGAYVRSADVSVLRDFFTFSLAQQPDILDDVMQARIAIECQAIRLACERASDGVLTKIGSRLSRLMDTLDDPEAGGAESGKRGQLQQSSSLHGLLCSRSPTSSDDALAYFKNCVVS
jgi:DNA-binding FadR family transcriptional regulator